MKIAYTTADVTISVNLIDGHTLPVIDHPAYDGETMSVEEIHLRYYSDSGQPWVTSWTCSGYSAATGRGMTDVESHRVPRRDWPGWVNDLVSQTRPKTGDRILPEL